MKEHDYFLELMSNPTFSPKDFLLVGLDSSNTELLNKDKYKNSLTIQNFELFLTNGKFDEKKFDLAYELALQQYNELSNLTESDKPFYRNDIFAPESLKSKDPEFKITKVINPLRKQSGFVDFGISEEPTKSVRELAEANLLYDYKTGEWLESPNERWWDNFLNPKVLALWDFDADENGNPTNDKDKIVYHKGEKKIDPNTGTYYYESLGGRNIYGREVLSGFDTLTTDGSTWNKYDFFDSDDIKKTTFGSLSRAVALIAPVFIPYVNTAYLTARVGLGLSEIMPTIGKIFLGSDNELMSQIEGWNKAFTFSTSDFTLGSEELEIKADPWTMETGLKLISDVFTQLAEQRFLFKYANAAASWVNPKLLGEGKKAEDARKAYLESQAALEGFNLNVLKRAKSKEELDLILKSELGIKWARAEAALNERLKAGLEIAKNASMAYMTGITTASSYGEAKLQGATDFEAAAFAIGYSLGEWRLLNSDIGKWILPELKLEKFENQSIAKALAAVTNKEAQNIASLASKEEKKNLFKKIVDLGKLAATGHYADDTITNTAKMTTAAALSEGFEETSEELLLDFAKTIFNIATELGSGAKFDDNWKDMATRYSMSFLGGTVGGGIATGLPGYRAARQRQRDIINSINNPDANTQAYKKLVNLALNGKLQDYKDTVQKMNFASESLSDRLVTNSDGTSSYETASSYEDSLDYKVKQRLIEQANIVEDILNSHGADFKLSDDLLLDELTRKLLKYYSLLGSNVLGVYTNEYLNYITKLVDVAAKVDHLEKRKKGIPEGKTDSAEREAKKEKELWTATDEAELKKYKDELKEIQDRLKMYRDGTMANEFIAEALFEMTVPISSIYGPTGLVKWIEDIEGKKYEELNSTEEGRAKISELTKLWEDGSIARREVIHRNYQVFKHNQQAFIDLLNKYEQNYFTDNEENVIRNLEEIFLGNKGREVSLTKSGDIIGNTEGYSLDALRIAGVAKMGLNEDILNALLQGIKGKVDLNIYDRFEGNLNSFRESFEEHFGFNIPLTIEEYQKLTPELRQDLNDTYEEILQGEEIPTNTEENFQNIIKKIQDTFIQDKLLEYNDFISTFIQNVAVLEQLINTFKAAKYITPATKLYLKTFINSANVSDLKIKDKLISEIDSIKSSPLEELLSQMVYSLTLSGFDTTGMVTDLALLINDLAQGLNLGEFSYSEEVKSKIENTIRLIDIAASHINAARTEYYGTIGDAFGYNASVNELSEKYPVKSENKSETKKVEKLPELQTGTADSMLHELAKLRNDLSFYKALYNANSSAKLTEHLKQEAKINLIYYANILKLSVEIPDDWGEEKSELIKAINDATVLRNTKDKEEKLSLEERKAIFKEKLRIEKAIYNLFQKHKIENLNLFKLLFKEFLDFDEEEKTSTINVDMKKEDNADFIWYIASLVAVDPEAVYKEYIEATDDPRYTPVIGLEEAIRRAYSYLVNPKTFEEFLGYVNQVVEELVTKEGIIQGFDVGNYILSSRHFLIEGDPGSGKTTATYNTLIRMLVKNHPELLEDVWIVSNSEENASNTAKDLGLENVTTLSKKQYFEKISENYHLTFGPNGELQIFEDELVKDDKGIRHYKNEKLKDVKVPKLILFDEISSFSLLDLLLSDKFLKLNNLYSLAAGDFKQLGALGWILSHEKDEKGNYKHFQEEENISIYLGLGNANFIGSWKLGTSMRSNNSYKSGNVTKVKLAFDTILQNIGKITTGEPISPITFSYHENPEKGLFGDKLISNIDTAKETIKTMLKTSSPESKINFITDDPGSELSLFIKNLNESEEYRGRFNIVSAGASQGQEGLYYIIDLLNTYNQARVLLGDPKDKSSNKTPAENFIKAFYTALSRAKLGSLIFGHYGDPNEPEKRLFNSIPQAKYQESSLSDKVKQNNAKERLDIINSAIENKEASTPPIDWISEKLLEKPNIDEEVILDEEITTKEDVLKRNIDPPVVIKNDEEGKLNILIHTFMCNETGCRVIDSSGQPNGTMDPMEDEAQLLLGDFHESRIDNIHGLVKISENSGGTINLPFETHDEHGNVIKGVKINGEGIITEGKKDLIEVLNRLREAGRNCDDYDNLAEVVKNILGTNENIGIDFIYDLYYEDYDGEEYTKEKFRDEYADYQERYKGKDENLSGIINDDNLGSEIHLPRNQVISMVITMENGKKLVRIPLAKITSPLTLLAQEEFVEIKKLYDKVGGNLTNFKKEIKHALINKESIPHLKEFAMLLDIYQGTAFNNIAYLNKLFNGTLAGFAKPTGITITNKPKGEEYLLNEHYYYNGKWVNISKYKKLMPWRNVSLIMVCVDKEPLVRNNKQITPGKPFVLMSDDPNLFGVDSKTLLELYVKQLKDPSLKPTVKLVEVIPPSLDTERYLFNLYTALNTHKDKDKEVDKDLGTKNTAFRLLSQTILKENSPFVTEYLLFIKDTVLDKVVKVNGQDVNLYKKSIAEFKALLILIKALTDYENNHSTHDLYNLLNTAITDLDKKDSEIKSIIELLKYNVEGESRPRFLQPTNSNKLTLRHLFLRKLNEMVFNTVLGSSEKVVKKNGNNIEYIKPEILKRVQTFIDSADWKEVQLHTRVKYDSNFDPIEIDDETNLNIALVETNYGNDYAIGKDGGEYQINGKADSTLYSLDIVPTLKWILTGALGRDPDVIDTDMDNENIFAVTPKAMSIKKGNNVHYYEETPSERESEEEKIAKKLLELDTKKLREITPGRFPRVLGTKNSFIDKFAELDEESRKKVLEDPREFIYLNLGILVSKQDDGKYKFFTSEEIRKAENVKFNSDGTTSFTLNGEQWILDKEEAHVINPTKLSPKGKPYLSTLFHDIPGVIENSEELNKVLVSKGGYNIFQMEAGARTFVIANINGVIVPFYMSSRGTDGKKRGQWYPFFGMTGNWLVKGGIDSEGKMNYSPEIDTVTELLNNSLHLDVDEHVNQIAKKIPGFSAYTFADRFGTELTGVSPTHENRKNNLSNALGESFKPADALFVEEITGIDASNVVNDSVTAEELAKGWVSGKLHINEILKKIQGLINPKYKVGDIIPEFRGYHNIIIKDIILNSDESITYLIDSDEIKDARVSVQLLDNYIPTDNTPQRISRIVEFLVNLNPSGPNGNYLMLDGEGNPMYADVLAISLMFTKNRKKLFLSKENNTPFEGKQFTEWLNDLLSTQEGKDLLVNIQNEIKQYLADSSKYIEEGKKYLNNCGTLPF